MGAKDVTNRARHYGSKAVVLGLLLALLTLMPATVATARSKGKKPPSTTTTTVPGHVTLNIWFDAEGDFKSDAKGNDGGCQVHDQETDQLSWDTQYDDVEVDLNGGELKTAPADLVLSSSSSWKTVNTDRGGACSNPGGGTVTVTCTSDHVDPSSAGDPQPQAWLTNAGAVLSMRVQAIGADFVANDTQGNNACPTQVTGSGQLLFAALLNAGLASNIPGYLTAHMQIPDSALASLATGKDAKDYTAHATVLQLPKIDAPKPSCAHGIWTTCTDSLSWHGVVLVHRVA